MIYSSLIFLCTKMVPKIKKTEFLLTGLDIKKTKIVFVTITL